MIRCRLCLCLFCLFLLLPGNARGAALTIGVLPASDSLALHVAVDEGLFDAQGLTVELVPFQSALEQSAALRGGAIDGWFTDIVMSLLLHETGVPQRIIATMAWSGSENRFFGVAVQSASSIRSPEDLKGATVAISRSTIIEYMLDAMLEQRGLPPAYVERLDIKQIAVRLQLFLAGKTDAVLLPEPLLSLMEARGARVVMDNMDLPMPLAVCAFAEQAAAPETVAAFQKALAEAMKRINNNPDVYRTVMLEKRLLPRDAQSAYRMLRYDPEHAPLPLPTVQELRPYAIWMVKHGLLPSMPHDLAEFVHAPGE